MKSDAPSLAPAGAGAAAAGDIAMLMEQVCRAYPSRICELTVAVEGSLQELVDSPLTIPLEEAHASAAAVKVEVPKKRLWSRPGRAARSIRESERNVSAFEACMAQVVDASLTYARQTSRFQEETRTRLLAVNLEVQEMMRCHRRASALLRSGGGSAPPEQSLASWVFAEKARLDVVRSVAESLDYMLRTCVEMLAARQMFSIRIRGNLAVAGEKFSDDCGLLLSSLRRTGAGVTAASDAARADFHRWLSAALAQDWAIREQARRALEQLRTAARLCLQLTAGGR